MKNSLGICWKVVVAGEILVQPLNSVGTKMQEERLSLETSGVFAWAIITILLCGASEFVLGKVVKHYSRKRQDGMNEKIGT
jgi:NitT/TauT family transport system permease protein